MNAFVQLKTTFLKFYGLFVCLLLGQSLAAQHVVSGNISTPLGVPIKGALVLAYGSTNDVTATDEEGNYALALPSGGSYIITPFSNGYPINGVTTFDMVLIAKHFTGELLFNSPYQIIAADADDSGTVDAADTSLLRTAILTTSFQFPDGKSWRFVPADHDFADPANPFPYPESVSINNLSSNMTEVDFVGMKVGDVNNTAIAFDIGTGGGVFEGQIEGDARFDENTDCTADGTENGLGNWLAIALPDDGGTPYAGWTDDNGHYNISLPNGSYAVKLQRPNGLWTICEEIVPGIVVNDDAQTADFAAQALFECPSLEVDLGIFRFRPCFETNLQISWCNKGTSTAENAYVELELDPLLAYDSAQIQGTLVGDNTWRFDLGDLLAGDCSQFWVRVSVDCEATLGQTLCVEARIFPDTICEPTNALWSGADLEVTGECVGGETVFTMKNKGTGPSEALEYVVIEDIMIQMTGSLPQLQPGQSQTVNLPANGSTWRVELEQSAYHPFNRIAHASVEGCGINGSGTFSTGFVTIFPNGNGENTEDEECQEVTGSFDPNDKVGMPEGVGNEHFVRPGNELEYRIRFQNTGTDTAFLVVIRDTLSANFDLTSVRPGASSHPYTFNWGGPGVLQFVFPNILLPDSTTNEPGSHGFINFRIRPKKDLPDPTRIENQAAIFFDFNAPVITNRTWHTISENFLTVQSVQPNLPGASVRVSPNPFFDAATLTISGVEISGGILQIFDAQNRPLREQRFSGQTLDLQRNGLPDGLYFFKIVSEGKLLASGKLSVQ